MKTNQNKTNDFISYKGQNIKSQMLCFRKCHKFEIRVSFTHTHTHTQVYL